MIHIKNNGNGARLFDAPRLFFTLAGQEKSALVIAELTALLGERYECKVFGTPDEVGACFESGISPNSAVALFDAPGSKCFTHLTMSRPDDAACVPSWTCGAQWAVKAQQLTNRATTCALQLRADFCTHFEGNLNSGNFPWGKPRKKEKVAFAPVMSENVQTVLSRLNDGPDLAGSMAANGHALELPAGSRISWFRVPDEPATCDTPRLLEVLSAFEQFEAACAALVREDVLVQKIVMHSVEIDPELVNAYLFPSANTFSVRRPDLHLTNDGVFASENDEMPGGMPELVHIDKAYGINQKEWRAYFDWLFDDGPVLFLISHEWSKCYVEEFKWLVGYLRDLGYNAHLRTTDNLDDIDLTSVGLFFGEEKFATVWRQFPIFEARDKVAEVVKLGAEGKVKIIPEFAHFGNKVWFSIFRSHAAHFRKSLPVEVFEILDEILPESHLITDAHSFPCRIGEIEIWSLEALLDLPEQMRDELVLKICGANNLAARSLGVLMGHGLSQDTWRQWINDRLQAKQSFIVQNRLETSISQLPVHNTKRRCGEMFDCRILLRPWTYGGTRLVSVSGCAVPSNTLRVHGRVDMAIIPVSLQN